MISMLKAPVHVYDFWYLEFFFIMKGPKLDVSFRFGSVFDLDLGCIYFFIMYLEKMSSDLYGA